MPSPKPGGASGCWAKPTTPAPKPPREPIASADRLLPTQAWFAGLLAPATPPFNPTAATSDTATDHNPPLHYPAFSGFAREPAIRLIRRPAEDTVRLHCQAARPVLTCQHRSDRVQFAATVAVSEAGTSCRRHGGHHAIAAARPGRALAAGSGLRWRRQPAADERHDVGLLEAKVAVILR